ncbi:MAG: endo-1,4-beta-xylanase [Bacteroidales bacterium]
MSNSISTFVFIVVLLLPANIGSGQDTKIEGKSSQNQVMKNALRDKFYIGVAMNSYQILGKDKKGVEIILEHFNSIVAENCMKAEIIQPKEGVFNFKLADKFVDFGLKNNMQIIGHCLIWHSQAPKWFFTDDKGKDVSREIMIARMKNHIKTLVGRYKGKVKGWDVLNEAFEDDGSWRKSKFYQIIGEDYIQLAFQFAFEADPKAELYYNDYSMAKEGRRNAVVKMVQNLQKQGVKIDGIGMQAHITMDFPSIEEEEKSIVAFGNLGVKVMITEMDLSTIPFPSQNITANIATSYEFRKEYDPYADGLPDSAALAIHNRYLDFFKLFLKHHDVISRVTVWGVQDGQSWKNNWPVKGRTDFPLLFDRDYKAKPIVESIIEEAAKAE